MRWLGQRPEADNLIGIYAALKGVTKAGVLKEFGGAQFSAFKAALVDLAVGKLGPIGAEMKRIVDIQLQHLQRLLTERKIVLRIDDQAKTWLANTGYDPVYGARPLKRVFQRQLQNPLAKMLLSGTIKDGDTVEVSVRDGQLTLNGSRFAEAA